MYPILRSIIDNFLKPSSSDLLEIETFKKVVTQEFKLRFFSAAHEDSIFVLNIATFLDPRYKNYFVEQNDDTTLNSIKDFIQTELFLGDDGAENNDNNSGSSHDFVMTALDILLIMKTVDAVNKMS